MKDGYMYFLTNWTNEVLYIGVTSNLQRRIFEHQTKTMNLEWKDLSDTGLVGSLGFARDDRGEC